MIAARLACPKCRRHVPDAYWQGVDVVRCPACQAEFEQLRFPAAQAARRVSLAATSVDGEASCFFHAQNRAETACEGCGRYLCSVCSVDFNGQKLCPSCLEGKATRRKLPENQRVLHDRIALLLAFFPVFVWPLTLVTAPATLVLCFYGWKKPGSIVPRWRRTSFVVAGVVATVQITLWIVLFTGIWLKR